MTTPARVALGVMLLLGLTAAPAAAAPADMAAKKQKRTASFSVSKLTAAPVVGAGNALRVRGRVANARGRKASRALVTFSLRTTSGIRVLRPQGTSNRIKRTRGGRSRAFSVRVVVPADAPAGAHVMRACVRRGRGVGRARCRTRPLRVTKPAPPANPPVDPPVGPGQGTPPVGQDQGAALRSLRQPLTRENFYFVMADRFENGTTANDTGGLPADRLQSGFDPTHKGFYHGGDLKGLLDRIDYIQGLGTTAIWLTPSFKNKPVQGPAGQETAGYHGYWITDFTQIDPHLGTNADLSALVQAAHARGMKVFFDIITNHTADVITYQQKPGGPAPYGYVPKDTVPYRDASGTPFDDRDYAGTDTFPPLDPAVSFPFIPTVSPAEAAVKQPAWLNDLTLYHNRGDTTFVGEDSQYGDFFGLDDLFTEHPQVVDGMAEIYEAWIRDFKIDGFRIDTMKHVNDEFWQEFLPRVLDFAHQQGKSEFMMFGEVFDTTKTYTSHFTTRDRAQAVLDFPFQEAARRFAADSAATETLRDFFVGDDWYTDADSNAYQLPTFLGNHDMGRIGLFIRNGNAGAADAEILARDRLAHELMYFARGNPVIYYGDEQGFVGDGGDQDARQDMFESQVASYNDDDNIGTAETPADDNFDPSHPLYQTIAALSAVTKAHPALRDGVQQHRLSSGSAGVYAFSRLDRASGREYVVALNNSEQSRSAFVPTAAGAKAGFSRIYGTGANTAATDNGRRLPVTVGPLSAVVYVSDAPIPASPSAPGIAVAPLPDGGVARDRVEVRAFVDGDSFYDVTFEAKVGDGDWTVVGTDDNDPYRVFHDVATIAPGTTVEYRATVLDNAGNVRTSGTEAVTVAEPLVRLTAPGDGAKIRNQVRLTAEVVPDDNDNVVEFQRSVDGGPWTTVDTDGSQPAYVGSDDVSALADGAVVSYRAVLTYAPGKTVTSAPASATVSPPVTTAVVHYFRPAGDYDDWGLHLWGDAIAPGVATDWTAPRQRDGVDGDGAYFNIPLADDTKPVNFIVHRPGGDSVPTTREPGGDRSFIPIDNPEIWLIQGDPTIYYSDPTP